MQYLKMSLHAAIFFMACFISSTALSEEHLDAVAMGGIELEPELSKNIKVKSQKIKISKDKIDIETILINKSSKTLEGTVKFILPPTPHEYRNYTVGTSTWDESYYQSMNETINKCVTSEYASEQKKTQILSGIDDRKNAPFLDFSISVNNQKVNPELEIKSFQNNVEISDVLIKNNIPVSADFAGELEFIAPLIDNQHRKEIKNKLKDLNLLNSNSFPNWKNQSIYFWKQIFPPNVPTKINLSYKPASGLTYVEQSAYSKGSPDNDSPLNNPEDFLKLFMKENIRYQENRTIQDFCPSLNFKNMIKSFFLGTKKFEDDILRIRQVILTSYSMDDESIEDFRLEIVPPKNGDIALCWPTSLIKNSEYYFVEHKNFIPPKQIVVLFVGD